MAALRPAADSSGLKQRAIEDARATQEATEQSCLDAGRDAPPYILSELIGKGSFGRVYKATETSSNRCVAVKIVSIDEGDSLNPTADTFSDIMKEIGTLKLLASNGAKNINPILDTLLIGHSMWMVTEYCAGGSVATLMRPTRGLTEQWIIPILREVAEALSWVHKQGIIHRDIKCANVFITESGSVQLGDFGVAGIIETNFDKRSTVTGTLYWMAPELFQSSVSYGTEVDIWAFGSMAYEVASGLPPNAMTPVDPKSFGSRLRQYCPRLEGDKYSSRLKDLIACCLVENPADRPSIEGLQIHPYISRTGTNYPTSSLTRLVKAYKLWEAQGGSRQSLFSAGGAQEASGDDGSPSDEWDFATTKDWNEMNIADAQKLFDNVYHPEAQQEPPKSQPRRRRPPANMKALTVPLEKIFDRNTVSNYRENAQVFYGGSASSEASSVAPSFALETPTSHESMIDLDSALDTSSVAWVAEPETIRASAPSLPTGSDPSNRRRTLDWTFAAADVGSDMNSDDESEGYSQSSSSAKVSQTMTSYKPPPSNFASDRMSNLSLIDLDETWDSSDIGSSYAAPSRMSTTSLIDLDESLAGDFSHGLRPSTATSDITSTSSVTVTEFELRRHATEPVTLPASMREPSIYVDDFEFGRHSFAADPDVIDLDSASADIHTSDPLGVASSLPLPAQFSDAGEPTPADVVGGRFGPALFAPAMPSPPSVGVAPDIDMQSNLKDELQRLISSLGEHLEWSSTVLESLPSRQMEQYSR